jgi:formylmethanofuran dehydrogenase subunit E
LIRPCTVVRVCSLSLLALVLTSIHTQAQQTSSAAPSKSARPFVGPPTPNVSADNVTALAEISFVHGGTEPFAVAGYRIGQRALKEFKLPRGSILIEVELHAPEDVLWTSIADGIQVATGVSAGKLSLHISKSPVGDVSTVIKDRRTGKILTFRLAPQFSAHFAGLSHDRLDAAGAQVIEMPDDQIFVMAASQ